MTELHLGLCHLATLKQSKNNVNVIGNTCAFLALAKYLL